MIAVNRKAKMQTLIRGTVTFVDDSEMAFEVKVVEPPSEKHPRGLLAIFDIHGYGSGLDLDEMKRDKRDFHDVAQVFCEGSKGKRADTYRMQYFDNKGNAQHQAKGALNIPPPTKKEMGASFAKATAKWFKAGMPVRTNEEIDKIFKTICVPCRYYTGTEDKGRCLYCGCSLQRRSGLVNKIKMATESCPKDKW